MANGEIITGGGKSIITIGCGCIVLIAILVVFASLIIAVAS